MKRRTIKSYFFKNYNLTYRNPSISTLFCFSKRAIKYRKQSHHPHKIYRNDKHVEKAFSLYKFYITNLVLYNQWVANKITLKNFFLMSTYLRRTVMGRFKKNKILFVKQVYIWYKLKNAFHLNLAKSLAQYPTTGMLSSHFVHFLAKKNIAYQARSKYRSKTFNLNPIYCYLYMYAKLLHLYLQILDLKLYFFTANLSKQRVIIDTAFNISISNWASTRFKYNPNALINTSDYNCDHYNEVMDKNMLIGEYFNETDVQKKDAMYVRITDNSKTIADLFGLSQRLYVANFSYVCVRDNNLYYFNELYHYL